MTAGRARPRPNSSRLEGRICLVTGGASGIGWALTRTLAQSGARVHACDISRSHLEHAQAELDRTHLAARVTLSRVDVTDYAALRRWITDAHTDHGRIDALIHNAAFIRWTDVEQMPVADAELTMRTGYDALVHAVSTVLPLMRATGSGHLIAVGSATGRVFVKGPSAAYAATKAAIEAYTEILGLELAGTRIGITLVRPGTVTDTDFFRTHVPPARMPRLADFLPTTTPEHVAEAIVGALGTRRRHIDLPGYLPAIYQAYAMAPGLMQTLAAQGGSSRRTYARPDTNTTVTPAPRRGSAVPQLVQKMAPRLIGPRFWASAPMRLLTVRADTFLQHRTRGRISIGRGLGVNSLLLATTGRKTGQTRHTPLFCFPHRGGYAVAGSNFGQPHHPSWSANLLADPNATLTIDGRTFPATSRLLHGEERTEAWKLFTAFAPGYQAYADRSGRHIRVFALDPTQG
ncbi:SDR family NAD(P)-dependent oxidoreductase [Streptomyces sp. H27-G5]|uniref:SDR family NAD(P)-dependent oxidoreductase n=1 Tax=Streptomyces sp. H27-G5 TaxID=2996698 RepID=UPI00226DB4B6|nr:SDR family NAD(P)-dependent oxidoreductase [Streptomyces sp. H27-G5]MCY0924048.1 SDR family NAD(P)-dependent oxidoreductase [Streptomyces sp. H27-G5]